MEENNNTTQQQKRESMSPFCEALMNTAAPLKDLMQSDDVAVVVCSDGKTVASRMAGNIEHVIEMIYSKMLDSPAFRHIIMSAAVIYSRNKADKTQKTAAITPLN